VRPSSRRLLRLALAGALLGGLASAAVSCRGATEVTLALSTDVACASVSGTTITVAAIDDLRTKSPVTTTRLCGAAGNIGTLVVVPGDAQDDGRFAVQVVTAVGVPLDSCKAPAFGKDCIVATRLLSFISHRSLELPIVMRAACRGVICPDGLTCSFGECVSAEIDPTTCGAASGCEPGQGERDGAAPPPPPPPIDAGTVDASGTDASVPADIVASKRGPIFSIAADATGTYWSELGDAFSANGGIYALDGAGGARTIAANRESPGKLVVDGTSVYWAELLGDGLVRAPIGGGAAMPVPISGGTGTNMTTIAVDAQYVYWNNESVGAAKGQIRRALKNGTAIAPIVSNVAQGPWAMELSGGTMAFVTSPQFGGSGQVSTVASAGGAVTVLAPLVTSSPTSRVAIAGPNVAWFTTENGGSIMAHTTTGTVPIATNQGAVASLAVTADSLYWVRGAMGSAGALVRASWTGAAETIYTDIKGAGPLTVGPSAIFVVDNAAGVIKRLPR
jgi:hypothetical protein